MYHFSIVPPVVPSGAVEMYLASRRVPSQSMRDAHLQQSHAGDGRIHLRLETRQSTPMMYVSVIPAHAPATRSPTKNKERKLASIGEPATDTRIATLNRRTNSHLTTQLCCCLYDQCCFCPPNLTARHERDFPSYSFQVRWYHHWPLCAPRSSSRITPARLAAARALYIAYDIWRCELPSLARLVMLAMMHASVGSAVCMNPSAWCGGIDQCCVARLVLHAILL